MPTLYPVAGQRIYIGPAMELPDDDMTAADFDDIEWVEIDGWETHGAIGDAAALITTPLINRGRDIKQKGTRNAGSMQNNFAIIRDDPGQIALIAASVTNHNYPFRIVGNDAPPVGSAPTPSERLFLGLVMGVPEQGGSANTAQLMQSTLEVNSNIVRVAAAAGA